MSIDLLKNWEPSTKSGIVPNVKNGPRPFDSYKYLSNNERKEITLQQFNDDFENAKEKTKKDIEQLENDELKKLNDDEEIRYNNNQLSSLLEFQNFKNKWSLYMFNFIKKTVSCNFDYSNIELVYALLTVIFMIIIYFILFLFYSFIKNKSLLNNKNNELNINLFIK